MVVIFLYEVPQILMIWLFIFQLSIEVLSKDFIALTPLISGKFV